MACALPVHAATFDAGLEAGRGNRVNVYGLDFGGDTGWRGNFLGHWGLRWEGRVQHWQADRALGNNRSLNLIGVMPVLRAGAGQDGKPGAFLDLGVGANVLSRHSLGNRELSTDFQFGELIGVGYAFGPQGRYELTGRLQHVSNAGIKRPNDGLTYLAVGLRVHF